MTLGTLKFRLTKMFPGVDLDILEGFIQDRYSEILSELPWERQRATAALQVVAPESTGSVDLTNGSTTVNGTGTVFTSAMTGRGFRAAGRTEIYEFTYTSATTGTLDRPYEGTTGTGIGYKIFQSVYVLPADCRMLDDVAFSGFSLGPLERMDRSELNISAPGRTEYGTPNVWATYMDDASTPPRMQVELYPIPDTAFSIPFDYTADASLPSNSAAFQAWMEPTALIEGVCAKVKRYKGDLVGAAAHKAEAAESLAGMRNEEARGMAQTHIVLDNHYTGHRAKRWCR